jgi:hypothetical protein
MARLINQGNVQDVKNSLLHSEANYTAKQLNAEIKAEQKGRNRITVINLLKAAIRRKKGIKVNRSSVDGKFVTESFAETNKNTTQSQKFK